MTTKRERPYKTSLTDKVDLLFNSELPVNQITQRIPLNLIKVSSFQPRAYFDKTKLEELAKTIAIHGILEPLLVREREGIYELIAGGRRYKAAEMVGLTEAPVIVLTLTDEQCLEVAILENLQREDLNPIEETEGILKLLESRLKQERKNITSLLYRLRNEHLNASSRNVSPNEEIQVVEKTFEPLGISWKSFVETRLPLLKLPEDILNAIKEGKIEYTKAKAIAKIKPEEKREEFLNQAIEENLSLSQIKERIEALTTDKQDGSSPLATPQKEIVDISQRLKKAQLWKKDPKKWRKVQNLLKKVNELLEDGGEEVGLKDNQD